MITDPTILLWLFVMLLFFLLNALYLVYLRTRHRRIDYGNLADRSLVIVDLIGLTAFVIGLIVKKVLQ